MTALGLAAALPFNSTKGDPLLALGPVFAIRAKDSIEGEQWALNKGTGGQVLRARYGSVGRAEIRRGVGLILPGTAAANYASSPSITIGTGDIEYVARIQLDNYITSGLRQQLIGRSTSADISSYLSVIASGYLSLVWSSDGSTSSVVDCTVDPGFVGGTAYWVKVSRKALDGVCKFYMAADQVNEPTTWTQIGTDVVSGAGTDIYQGTSQIELGTRNNGVSNYSSGSILRGIIRNSPDGITLFDVDFTQQNDFTSSFTCTTGQTVTVTAANAVDTNDPTTLKKSGPNHTYFPGATGDYISLVHTSVLSSLETLEFIVKVRFNALGTYQYLAGTDSTHFVFALSNTNRLAIYVLSTPGLVQIGNALSAVVPGIAAGVDVWLRGRLTVSTAQCSYWYSYDSTDIQSNVSWISLTGGTGANAGTTPLLTGSVATIFGTHSAGIAGMSGRMYNAAMICDGTVRAHVDMTGASLTLLDGNNVSSGPTYVRPASGLKAVHVTQPAWLFGNNDYLEIADNDLLDMASGQDFSAVVIARTFGSPAVSQAFISKGTFGSLATPNYTIVRNSSGPCIQAFATNGDGSTYWYSGNTYNPAGGALDAYTILRSGTTLNLYTDNTSRGTATSAGTVGAGNLTGTNVLRIGNNAVGGTAYLDAEIFAVYIYRKALTAAEIAAGVQYWNAA